MFTYISNLYIFIYLLIYININISIILTYFIAIYQTVVDFKTYCFPYQLYPNHLIIKDLTHLTEEGNN